MSNLPQGVRGWGWENVEPQAASAPDPGRKPEPEVATVGLGERWVGVDSALGLMQGAVMAFFFAVNAEFILRILLFLWRADGHRNDGLRLMGLLAGAIWILSWFVLLVLATLGRLFSTRTAAEAGTRRWAVASLVGTVGGIICLIPFIAAFLLLAFDVQFSGQVSFETWALLLGSALGGAASILFAEVCYLKFLHRLSRYLGSLELRSRVVRYACVFGGVVGTYTLVLGTVVLLVVLAASATTNRTGRGMTNAAQPVQRRGWETSAAKSATPGVPSLEEYGVSPVVTAIPDFALRLFVGLEYYWLIRTARRVLRSRMAPDVSGSDSSDE